MFAGGVAVVMARKHLARALTVALRAALKKAPPGDGEFITRWIADADDSVFERLVTDKIAELTPQLVTFNGSSFDLPVLRYRAMVHRVAAPGLLARPYFNRFNDDAIDLCDVLSSFAPQAKARLHELCRVMGIPGKPDGIDGARSRVIVLRGGLKRSPTIARQTSSIRTAFGCGTNCFGAGLAKPNIARANTI